LEAGGQLVEDLLQPGLGSLKDLVGDIAVFGDGELGAVLAQDFEGDQVAEVLGNLRRQPDAGRGKLVASLVFLDPWR
jgi:hypothetical protein